MTYTKIITISILLVGGCGADSFDVYCDESGHCDDGVDLAPEIQHMERVFFCIRSGHRDPLDCVRDSNHIATHDLQFNGAELGTDHLNNLQFDYDTICTAFEDTEQCALRLEVGLADTIQRHADFGSGKMTSSGRLHDYDCSNAFNQYTCTYDAVAAIARSAGVFDGDFDDTWQDQGEFCGFLASSRRHRYSEVAYQCMIDSLQQLGMVLEGRPIEGLFSSALQEQQQ